MGGRKKGREGQKRNFILTILFALQQRDQLERYVPRYLVYCLVWSFSGDSRLKTREDLGSYIRSIATIPLPAGSKMPIVDYEVCFTFVTT